VSQIMIIISKEYCEHNDIDVIRAVENDPRTRELDNRVSIAWPRNLIQHSRSVRTANGLGHLIKGSCKCERHIAWDPDSSKTRNGPGILLQQIIDVQ